MMIQEGRGSGSPNWFNFFLFLCKKTLGGENMHEYFEWSIWRKVVHFVRNIGVLWIDAMFDSKYLRKQNNKRKTLNRKVPTD